MFVTSRGSIWGILKWQWKSVLTFTLSASVIIALDELLPQPYQEWVRLPALPLAVVGGALGIFMSFRTNSAYDRWWEGRKLWGRLINSSRHWCSQVLSYLGPDDAPNEVQQTLVRRHILYVHVLRCLLRAQDPTADADVQAFTDDEGLDAIGRSSNATHLLLNQQMAAVQAETQAGRLDALRLQLFDQTIFELLNIQGGCERIKKTPFPRGYVFVANRLIVAFGFLFPLGIVEHLGWFSIPVSVLVCMSFLLISEVGRVLEDPFTLFWPALPLFALSKTIEINLRERLGETDLPAMPQPNARGILM